MIINHPVAVAFHLPNESETGENTVNKKKTKRKQKTRTKTKNDNKTREKGQACTASMNLVSLSC